MKIYQKKLDIAYHGNVVDSYGISGFVIKSIGMALSGAILPALAFVILT